MNNLDKQYQSLLQDILDNGVEKKDRTGTGTISVFGRQIRHKMSEGFPLLTTKKMAWKTMVTELLWFLRGDTNIKYLVDNDCHIWDGDAYKMYFTEVAYNKKLNNDFPLSKEGFIERIKTDDEFAKTWGELGPIYSKQWREWKTEVAIPTTLKIDDGDAYKRYVTHWGDPIDPVNFELYTRLDLHPDKRLFTKEEFINKIKTDDEFAKTWGDLGPIYGKQWREWSNYRRVDSVDEVWSDYRKEDPIDQIANLINELKTNPDSRRLMVSSWNVADLDKMVLPPCHYSFQVYTRELTWEEQVQWVMKNTDVEWENLYIVEEIAKDSTPKRAISLMWNQRSVDTFLGLPFNIASYGLLLEMIADEVQMIPDELIGNLGDTHLYLNHIEQAKEQIKREPFRLPNVHVRDGIESFMPGDIILENYVSHPKIKAPLSN